MYANLFRLFADEIKVDTEDDPQRARIIAFSVWGILRGLESFSQLIYTNSQYPGLVSRGFPRYSTGLRSRKISNREWQNLHFRPKLGLFRLKMTVYPRYLRFLRPRVVKTSNTKTANNEGRLYKQRSINHYIFSQNYIMFWISIYNCVCQGFGRA
jgi:hypothetical protein